MPPPAPVTPPASKLDLIEATAKLAVIKLEVARADLEHLADRLHEVHRELREFRDEASETLVALTRRHSLKSASASPEFRRALPDP